MGDGSLGRVVRYLAACHEADQRASAFFDLFHRSVTRRFVFEGEELVVAGVMDELAMPEPVALELEKQAALYRRERRLVYAAIVLRKTRRIASYPRSFGSSILVKNQ